MVIGAIDEPVVFTIHNPLQDPDTVSDKKALQASIDVSEIIAEDIQQDEVESVHPKGEGHQPSVDLSAIIADDTPPNRRIPRISLPIELMQSSYDTVVIGSGYGGSVAASRMARGGQSVCVLERGKEKWPGEYPESLLEAAKEVRVSGEFAPGDRRGVPGRLIDGGNPTGLFHLAMGEGQNAIAGNGLGGTSLVNANVFLEATSAILEMEMWPKELQGADKWEKYYQRAADVLEPVTYPKTHPQPLKAKLLQKQAQALGLEKKFSYVRQTTRFKNGPNSTGVPMQASKLSGMDATGINDGSKSSTLVNYLSDAWNWGAEIFCECEVRYISKAPDREGYIIHFASHSRGSSQFKDLFYEDLLWVHAKKLVFLGAGSLGTTEILLRSKQLGLEISDSVGTGMSGNGSMLGFGYNTDHVANGACQSTPSSSSPVGPCITSILDLRDQANPLDGFVVEDCAIPLALRGIITMFDALTAYQNPIYSATLGAFRFATQMIGKTIGFPGAAGSIDKTIVYLVTSHDSSQGHLKLKNDKPVLAYPGVGRSKTVSRIHKFLEKMTSVVGGTFIANPFWSLFGAQQLTAHPIGGAGMSPDGTGERGVTNHIGQVFKNYSSDVHEGLVVCDGAMLPSAIGVNPLATITALAERSVELVAQDHSVSIDYDTKNGLLDLFGKPAHTHPKDQTTRDLANTIAASSDHGTSGIEFSEVMTGFISTRSDIKDFQRATAHAKSCSSAARLFISIKSWNTTELVNNTSANITGTLSWAGHDGVFLIQRGTLQLFNKDTRRPETKNLTYDCQLLSPSGRLLHFNGYKVVNAGSFLNPLEVWRQTSTLYTTITDPELGVIGRGTLNIRVGDFAQQLQTFRTSGPTMWSKLTSATSFLTYFGSQLVNPFLSTFGRLEWPNTKADDGLVNPTPPSENITVEASDGVETSMLMWNPRTSNGAEDLASAPVILFVPGASVNHNIFACPTIETNAVNYFRSAGYRQYCLTFRIGMTPAAKLGWTPYDARRDIHAALAKIREIEAARHGGTAPQVYVIAHCVGSLSLSCALLDGTIPRHWIKAMTCSQVFFTPRFGRVNQITSAVPVWVYGLLVGPWWDCHSTPDDTLLHRVLNQVLRLYPVGSARETCRSVVCHRGELVFGRLWNHENLNEATHNSLERIFGGVSMLTVGWLTKTGRQGYVATNDPANRNLVVPENLDRLRGLPILFVSGEDNVIYTPESTDITYTMLCNAHGRKVYERVVIPNTGHLDTWMGTESDKKVYPRVLRHIDKHMKTVK